MFFTEIPISTKILWFITWWKYSKGNDDNVNNTKNPTIILWLKKYFIVFKISHLLTISIFSIGSFFKYNDKIKAKNIKTNCIK